MLGLTSIERESPGQIQGECQLCKAVRDAYDKGWRDAATRAIRILERHKEVES